MTFIESVKHALRGLGRAAKTEPNIRWQLLVMCAVIMLGFFLQLTRGEWLVIMIVSGLVIIIELINTALEKTLDIMKPRFDEHVGLVKDIAAGAVLVASSMAFVVGIMVFWPHLFLLATGCGIISRYFLW